MRAPANLQEMIVSSEAKRTLVKSPPELWSEVSDADSLARHLDGLQQIAITRVEPETAVEWEAEGASGSVRLQPSGFGTKVTLSLSRELTETVAPQTAPEPAVAEPAMAEPELALPEPEPAEPEPEPVVELAEPEPAIEPEPPAIEAAVEREPEPAADEADAAQPTEPLAGAQPEPVATPEPPKRPGFFARLFKPQRERAVTIEAEPEPDAAVEPGPEIAAVEAEPAAEPQADPVEPQAEAVEPQAGVEIEPAATGEPEPAHDPAGPPAASVTADLAALEAEMAQQDEAMLTAMLDRLGAAHHRPFSRG